MTLNATIEANLEGVQCEHYSPIELSSDESEKAKTVKSLKRRVVLFRDELTGNYYRKGLLTDSNDELYWIEWLNNKEEKVTRRYHLHDLNGLMIRVYP